MMTTRSAYSGVSLPKKKELAARIMDSQKMNFFINIPFLPYRITGDLFKKLL